MHMMTVEPALGGAFPYVVNEAFLTCQQELGIPKSPKVLSLK